jgi:GT2 family glycosyltransferase
VDLFGECSVGVVIRDRLSVLPSCLRALQAQGLDALPVVAVVGEVSAELRESWRAEFSSTHFVFRDAQLTAGRARNIALSEITTPVAALIDADVIGRDGWLDQCCERLRNERLAAVVVPLILDSPQTVHAAGNLEYVERRGAIDHLHREARFSGMPYGDECVLPAAAVDYGEAHCLVCDVAAVRAVGGFDDELAEFDDVDLGRRVRAAQREVWFEPAAVVEFRKSAPIELEDIDVFAWRWARPTIRGAYARFSELWGVDITEGGSMDAFVRRYNLRLTLARRIRKEWALAFDRWLQRAYFGARKRIRRA